MSPICQVDVVDSFSPTLSTVPTMSQPGEKGLRLNNDSGWTPSRMRISANDTPAANIFTRTSWARGSGISSSIRWRFSGPPNRDTMTRSYFTVNKILSLTVLSFYAWENMVLVTSYSIFYLLLIMKIVSNPWDKLLGLEPSGTILLTIWIPILNSISWYY
jgi:hypothetical protein